MKYLTLPGGSKIQSGEGHTDFEGNTIVDIYAHEIPAGINRPAEHIITGLLPVEVEAKGYKLIEVSDRLANFDPVVIYDRWGNIVHEWPENYMPSFVEVREVCKELRCG